MYLKESFQLLSSLNAFTFHAQSAIANIDDFDKLSKNEAFKEEINSWRLSLKEISEANIEFIQSAIALENNQNDEAVSHYTWKETAHHLNIP